MDRVREENLILKNTSKVHVFCSFEVFGFIGVLVQLNDFNFETTCEKMWNQNCYYFRNSYSNNVGTISFL